MGASLGMSMEAGMIGMFVLSSVMLLVHSIRHSTFFSKFEKMRAVTFFLAFVMGLLAQIWNHNALLAGLDIVGIAVSEFIIAFTFYDTLKDKETMYE